MKKSFRFYYSLAACPSLQWPSEAIEEMDIKLNELFRYIESQKLSTHTLKQIFECHQNNVGER